MATHLPSDKQSKKNEQEMRGTAEQVRMNIWATFSNGLLYSSLWYYMLSKGSAENDEWYIYTYIYIERFWKYFVLSALLDDEIGLLDITVQKTETKMKQKQKT